MIEQTATVLIALLAITAALSGIWWIVAGVRGWLSVRAELEEEVMLLRDALAAARSKLADYETESRLETDTRRRLTGELEACKARVVELEKGSRVDHQTIGELHDELRVVKRKLSAARGRITRLTR